VIELVLSVPDISCGHCITRIESSVGQLAGIGTVQVDLSAKTVRVTGTADREAVRAAIADAGYEAI
jgi:copper ion binding protein